MLCPNEERTYFLVGEKNDKWYWGFYGIKLCSFISGLSDCVRQYLSMRNGAVEFSTECGKAVIIRWYAEYEKLSYV